MKKGMITFTSTKDQPSVKHFVIIDDESAEAKALIEQAKKLLGVRIITELELEQLEDAFMADAIDEGMRSEVAEMEEVYRILDRKAQQ